jgi:hypothetical protein
MAVCAAAMAANPFVSPEELMLDFELGLMLPFGFAYRLHNQQAKAKAFRVYKMYLMENGRQLIVETYDGVLQKLNILASDKYEIGSTKDGSGVMFTMCNNERDFEISTQGAKLINYDLTDRIVKGICIDTKKRGNLYHRTFDRQ